ncbi:MAG: putative TonB protein [Myxococcales bacterium]|nr:putative TonB protein [Myxococcales bacterium]
MKRACLAILLASCTVPAASTTDYASRLTQATTVGDVAAIEGLLHETVFNGGLWFNDPECTKQFPAASALRPDRFHAFAVCLAGLKLQASVRVDPLPDTVVLTYAPGIEIEARILDDGHGARLSWIGYESHRDVPDGLPSISREAFEALRITGDRNGPLAPAEASKLELDVIPDEALAYAWVRVCIDGTGVVTGVDAREATSLRAARIFTDAAKAWTFRPFVPTGQAVPACSMVRMTYPPRPHDDREILPVPMDPSAPEAILLSRALNRTAGETIIPPDDSTKKAMSAAGITRVIGSFKLCLNETGHVGRVETIRSTGLPPYDTQLRTQISHWVYRPVLDENDKPISICTGVTFVYSQTSNGRR